MDYSSTRNTKRGGSRSRGLGHSRPATAGFCQAPNDAPTPRKLWGVAVEPGAVARFQPVVPALVVFDVADPGWLASQRLSDMVLGEADVAADGSEVAACGDEQRVEQSWWISRGDVPLEAPDDVRCS